MFEMIKYEKIGKVARITINRPETYNALNKQAKDELTQAFRQAQEDPGIGCAMLTGAGDKAFCSGQDLHESMNLDPSDAEGWVRSFEGLYLTIRDFEKPLVAVVNGVSTGSGFQLPLLCDIRLCASTARFAMTEIDVGFACIIGSTLMWDVLGRGVTTDMVLSGRFMDAEEAIAKGLVTKVIEPDKLEAEALAYCAEMAEKAPVATKMNKLWYKTITDQRFKDCIEFAVKAHTEGYKANEPNEYQTKFFEVRKQRKG